MFPFIKPEKKIIYHCDLCNKQITNTSDNTYKLCNDCFKKKIMDLMIVFYLDFKKIKKKQSFKNFIEFKPMKINGIENNFSKTIYYYNQNVNNKLSLNSILEEIKNNICANCFKSLSTNKKKLPCNCTFCNEKCLRTFLTNKVNYTYKQDKKGINEYICLCGSEYNLEQIDSLICIFNNMNIDNNNLLNEIKNLKIMIKNSIENQNSLQSKIIDYNRIISQQENIIRMNTSKLNEHDNKLSNILLSFNNYLQIQDKSTAILNECQNRIENSLVHNETFNEFKNNILQSNQNLNEKIASVENINERLNNFFNDMKNEHKNFQNYTIEKLKNIIEKQDNSLLNYKQENLNIINNNNETYLKKINQLKSLLDLNENNLNDEIKSRKKEKEKILKDVNDLLKQNEIKFQKVEKNALEQEKNLIKLQKDYANTFQQLIQENQEKNNNQIESLKNLIDGGLTKLKNEFQDILNNVKENLNILRTDYNENKTTIEELEAYLKENVKNLSENYNEIINNQNKINENVKKSYENQDTILKDIDKKFKDAYTNLSKRYDIEFKNFKEKVNNRIGTMTEKNTKDINDLFDKYGQIQQMLHLSNNENNKENKLAQSAPNLNNQIDEENYDIKLNKLNNSLYEVENKVKKNLEEDLEKIRDKFKTNLDNYSNIVNDTLEKKINVLMSDLDEKFNNYKTINDGILQGYIVESEKRTQTKLDNELNEIKNAIKELYSKNEELMNKI